MSAGSSSRCSAASFSVLSWQILRCSWDILSLQCFLGRLQLDFPGKPLTGVTQESSWSDVWTKSADCCQYKESRHPVKENLVRPLLSTISSFPVTTSRPELITDREDQHESQLCLQSQLPLHHLSPNSAASLLMSHRSAATREQDHQTSDLLEFHSTNNQSVWIFTAEPRLSARVPVNPGSNCDISIRTAVMDWLTLHHHTTHLTKNEVGERNDSLYISSGTKKSNVSKQSNRTSDNEGKIPEVTAGSNRSTAASGTPHRMALC